MEIKFLRFINRPLFIIHYIYPFISYFNPIKWFLFIIKLDVSCLLHLYFTWEHNLSIVYNMNNKEVVNVGAAEH